MKSINFMCHFEDTDWRMRTSVYTNEYLYLYESEPEDAGLLSRFGIKFFTQPKNSLFDIRCTNANKEHAQYEHAIIAALIEVQGLR